jgi:uncharacterized protein YdaU (DUF1376 family)
LVGRAAILSGMGRAMSKRPVLPLWCADLMGDTQGLSQGEFGAYLLLLITAWMDQGSLPDDDVELQRIARAQRWWSRQRRRVLERYFVKGEDGRWRQKRLTQEIKKVAEYSAGRRQNRKKQPKVPVDNPVDNPVETCGQLRTRYPDKDNQKPNEINGRFEHVFPLLLTNQNISSSLSSSDRARASGNSRQQKQELKLNRGKSTEAALHRQASNAARAAWEAGLAKTLKPGQLAELIDWLAINPAVADRATLREQQEPGAGAQAVAVAFMKSTGP